MRRRTVGRLAAMFAAAGLMGIGAVRAQIPAPPPATPPAGQPPASPPPAFAPAPPLPVTFENMDIAVLRTLDKVTARVSTFDAPVGQASSFGTLQIEVRACRKRPPDEPPESAAFLKIVEKRPDEGDIPVFEGWMFASSPAVSALEHAIYDVWVIDCKKASSAPASRPR